MVINRKLMVTFDPKLILNYFEDLTFIRLIEFFIEQKMNETIVLK